MKTTRRLFTKLCLTALFSILLIHATSAKSCLWKVTSGDNTLYLAGSIHMLKESNYPLAPAFEQAYKKSTTLVLEADLSEMQSAEMQQLALQKALAQKPLDQVLDAKVYSDFKAEFSDTGILFIMVKNTKPWFAATQLALGKIMALGFNPMLGLDYHYHGRAVSDQKKVIGLETAEFQINLLDSLADEDPNDFIKRAISEVEILEKELDKLLSAWTKGDVDVVGNIITESFNEHPEIAKKFITDRNHNWMKSLNSFVKDKDTELVIVGVGHLPGKDGLLELLKKEGYTVEQL